MATANPIPFPASSEALIVRRFENYLFAKCGQSASTVALNVGFARRIGQEIGFDPSPDNVEAYIAAQYRLGRSYAHISNACKALEHYMRFCGHPVKLGRPRKPERVLVDPLTEAEVAIMLFHCKTLRDRALLATLAYSGVRNAELCRLRVRDVDVAGEMITVECGKFSKDRRVPIAGDCVELLVRYLEACGGRPDDLLFETVRRHNELEPQDVRKFVRAVAKRSGLERRVWPHLLRHSLATSLLHRGAHLLAIQAQLGHADVSTTMMYLHAAQERLRQEYRQYCPSYL